MRQLDGNVLYDRITIEVFDGGVFRVWWLDGERVSTKKIKDLVREIKVWP